VFVCAQLLLRAYESNRRPYEISEFISHVLLLLAYREIRKVDVLQLQSHARGRTTPDESY
jgi:hypothetical protein